MTSLLFEIPHINGPGRAGGEDVPADSRSVTVDVIVFAVSATGTAILLYAGAEGATAPRPLFRA